jgi:hypothetical protein
MVDPDGKVNGRLTFVILSNAVVVAAVLVVKVYHRACRVRESRRNEQDIARIQNRFEEELAPILVLHRVQGKAVFSLASPERVGHGLDFGVGGTVHSPVLPSS